MSRDVARSRVLRFAHGEPEPVEVTDELAGEEPLEIRIGGEPVSVTMRTPGHDLELTAGFLLAEGVVAVGDAPPLIRQEEPNAVNVAGVDAGGLERRRSVMATSCGLCGKGSIEAVHRSFAALPIDDAVRISRELIAGLTAALESAQSGFARTGGAHGAGLFDVWSGETVVVREDVGRHNAVDKVIGHALLRRLLPLSHHLLLVSGRVSFEIVQKALGARVPAIASVSAPSSLAVEFAESNGQTLIGFLRPGRWNVYAHPERIGL